MPLEIVGRFGGDPVPKIVPKVQQNIRRKMRDVSDSKKVAYFDATSRVINFATAKRSDLMLCVKENQMAIA